VKENRLSKSDFIVKGSQIIDYMGSSPYNLVKYPKTFRYADFSIFSKGLSASNSSKFMETYRGIRIYDSYSMVCERYGKKALKKKTTKDLFYLSHTSSSWTAKTIKYFKSIWNKHYNFQTEYLKNKNTIPTD